MDERATENYRGIELRLKTWQAALGICIMIVTLVITPIVTYIRTQDEVQRQLIQIRLEVEQSYARKNDLQRFDDKLDKISGDLAEVKGFLKGKK